MALGDNLPFLNETTFFIGDEQSGTTGISGTYVSPNPQDITAFTVSGDLAGTYTKVNDNRYQKGTDSDGERYNKSGSRWSLVDYSGNEVETVWYGDGEYPWEVNTWINFSGGSTAPNNFRNFGGGSLDNSPAAKVLFNLKEPLVGEAGPFTALINDDARDLSFEVTFFERYVDETISVITADRLAIQATLTQATTGGEIVSLSAKGNNSVGPTVRRLYQLGYV